VRKTKRGEPKKNEKEKNFLSTARKKKKEKKEIARAHPPPQMHQR
jgi:hypothetical protein